MARLDPPANPGPLTRLTWRIAKRRAGGGRLPEPVAIQGHHPRMMNGYGAIELAFAGSHRVPERLKLLAELKAGATAGCEWCLDYGSWLARGAGISEEQLRSLPTYRESELFDADERLVIEYAEGISRTPVDVPDELFARLRERFDEPQIVELTWAAAIENLRARFNWALGIGSQGYSEGAFCVRPEGSATARDQVPRTA
jgi:4-carboxymuconolactone decarboxylase